MAARLRWSWPWLSTLAMLLTAAIYALYASGDGYEVASNCVLSSPCWCEASHEGLIRQPFNTWSNLPVLLGSFVLAGYAVGAGPGRQRVLLAMFSYGLWAQGFGALWFHGTLTPAAQLIDKASIFFAWGVVISTTAYRVGLLPLRALYPAAAATSTGSLIYVVGLQWDINPLGLTCLGSFLAMESFIRWRQGPAVAPWPLRLGLASFIVALVAWSTSLPGAALCEAGFHGHALWHVAAGLAVTMLGVHTAIGRPGPQHA